SLDKGLLATTFQRNLQPFRNRARDLVLNLEHILHLAVVTLRPQMVSVRRIHQLRRDAQTAVSSSYASLKNCSHVQPFTDNAQVDVLSFERKSRTSRNHVQLFNPRQGVDDLFSDPI